MHPLLSRGATVVVGIPFNDLIYEIWRAPFCAQVGELIGAAFEVLTVWQTRECQHYAQVREATDAKCDFSRLWTAIVSSK